MHALHGNTPPPDIGEKIAIWWPGDGVPDGWYTGCVTGRDGRAKHIVDVEYDCDGLTWTHDLHDFQWDHLLHRDFFRCQTKQKNEWQQLYFGFLEGLRSLKPYFTALGPPP